LNRKWCRRDFEFEIHLDAARLAVCTSVFHSCAVKTL
jgi:hypothetical protein